MNNMVAEMILWFGLGYVLGKLYRGYRDE